MTYKLRFFADFCLALTASQTLIRGSLALANVRPSDEWSTATAPLLPTVSIMGFIRRAPLKMRFFCASIVGDVLTSSCMAYTLRCCVRRRLTSTEKSLFLEAPRSEYGMDYKPNSRETVRRQNGKLKFGLPIIQIIWCILTVIVF